MFAHMASNLIRVLFQNTTLLHSLLLLLHFQKAQRFMLLVVSMVGQQMLLQCNMSIVFGLLL